MTEQQNLRDRRNEKQLEQTISFSNLNSYAELHQQYRVEYDRMKNSISRLQHNKQNQLAILRGNLRNNRRKLTKFNDERLELLKEEIILNEDIIQKTQQEEQHEHEHEINWLQDSNITIVDEFNPYCLLKQSLRALTNIDQTNLNDIRFDLNQIEHYYRGIHYSYNIDMQELKEIINSLKIEGNQLKDFELNKLFGDFIREIELITIEKVLDRLDKQSRGYLLQNFKLTLNYLNSSNEEYIFSYLDSNFLNHLSQLRSKFDICNDNLLIRIENGLNNIKEKKFLEESSIIDDVEQIVALFDARRLFRLECASIDFHHSNTCLTALELDMLEFNRNPTFQKLISLVQRIANKQWLNTLIDHIKQKNLSPQYYHNIVNKLLSSYADFNETKRQSIEETLNQIEDSIITDQSDEEIKDRWKGPSIEKVTIETILLQVFYELNSTLIDKTLRDNVKNDYRKQVEFVLKQATSEESREKIYFMFVALGRQNYQYQNQLRADDPGLIESLQQKVSEDEEQRPESILFKLNYSYYNLQYEYENLEESKMFDYQKRLEYRILKLREITKLLSDQRKNTFLYDVRQICNQQLNTFEDNLLRLKITSDPSANNILNEIKSYLKNYTNENEIFKSPKSLEKLFEDVSITNTELLKCLLNSLDFRSSSNSFDLIRDLRNMLSDKKIEDRQTIFLAKYFLLCQVHTLPVRTSLSNLREKLDQIDELENTVNQVLIILNNEFGIDTNKSEFYNDLVKLLDEVQLHYERQLELPNTFKDFPDNNITNIRKMTFDLDQIKNLIDNDLEKMKVIQFSYKGEEKLSHFADVMKSSTYNREEKIFWLEYLYCFHNDINTDQVLRKILLAYTERIKLLRKKISDAQLQSFLNRHSKDRDSDISEAFLTLIQEKNDQLITAFLYYIKNQTIGVLLSSNKKGHFNDLITILEDKEYVLICSLLEPLYRKALDKQKLNERTLFNYKQDIINAYNINKDASDKNIHEVQKTLIDLYLIKYDRILVDNTDGDLFYLHRIEQFKKLSNEIKDKTNEQIENILAQYINREIFHRLTTRDEHLNLHDGAKIYDCSWSNPNEFQEKYQILIDLYSSYRIDLFREMIRRPLNEQNFQSNLIDIARQVTYLLGVKTEDALIELESNIQIEAISLFIQEFYNLTIDRMFPSRDEQIVLSDFIFALDYFLEQRLEYLLSLEIHDDEKRMKLNTLESEIKKLKICLNKKIYKENNYRLVEYEYENLIQAVSENEKH
ncbi:unnamed protein product [Rotaria magnacalcarata]|uniref:Uncharacterized protein n=1 Tax=Rotaria magnacalcarata TaxID=392030 RepID=A0A819P650_9BILA|nr:unnamed protein product [Rotaria magnacalcarata]